MATMAEEAAEKNVKKAAMEKVKAGIWDKEGSERYKNADFLWTDCGGTAIDTLLQHTPLIDAQFLVELHKAGGVVPRNQDVTKAALIDARNAWRLRWPAPDASVLVLSYPWLDKEHPDREGEQLAKIVPILEVMLKKAKEGGQV